jgi:hypothetical protein
MSRYWWQRGGTKILSQKSDVPLPQMLSIASPGEGYDAVNVLRWKLFSKKHLLLLLQVVTVFIAALASGLGGPLAQVSLRSAKTVRSQAVEVLQAWNSGEDFGNRNNANVEWNETITSLNAANFPYSQMMDYLPPSSIPWTYTASEWDPIWSAECSFEEETPLEDLVASGEYTFHDPLGAFPSYRDTYSTMWLNTSQFRPEANFAGEMRYSDEGGMVMKDMVIWILIQSEPMANDRAMTNNETLRLSLSALHVKDFQVLTFDDPTNGGETEWRPNGTITNASYTRVECSISRKSVVLDEKAVPWLWTNDTYSITNAYRQFWMTYIGERSNSNLTVAPPTPHELFRFYQAYMVSVNTWNAKPYSRKISVWRDTVQLSIACLILILLLIAVELWLTARYLWFLRRNKQRLNERCIPDGKVDWMVYNARLAEQFASQQRGQGEEPPRNRDYFRRASFGNGLDPNIQSPGLVRVYNSLTLTPATICSNRRSSLSKKPTRPTPPRIVIPTGKEAIVSGHELNRKPSCNRSCNGIDSAVSSDRGASQYLVTPNPDAKILDPQLSRRSSVTMVKPTPHGEGSSPTVSFYSEVGDGDKVDAITSVTLVQPVTTLIPTSSTNARPQEAQCQPGTS